jgi:hypothetical protein
MTTRIVIVVALLISSASVALANDQFDVNIYRPAIQHSPHGAYAQSPTGPNDPFDVIRPDATQSIRLHFAGVPPTASMTRGATEAQRDNAAAAGGLSKTRSR